MIYLKERNSGKVFDIKRELMRIGRSSEAEINLSFQSISRHHATLYAQNNQLIIEDAGSQNGVRINSKKIAVATSLSVGDVIELGGIELEVGDTEQPAPKVEIKAKIVPPQAQFEEKNFESSSAASKVKRPANGSKRPLMIGVALAILVLGIFLMPDEETARGPASNVDENPLSKDEITKALNSDSYAKHKYSPKTPTEVEAESRFRQAMRDYYDGNYSRAIVVLKQALVANPSHAEATEYLQFAEKRLDNQIDLLMKSGQRSYSVLQYSRARSEFNQVLSILSEQIPGYWQRVSSELNAKDSDRRPAQEEVLLNVPCSKTRRKESCALAVEMIQLCRKLLGEEDVLK